MLVNEPHHVVGEAIADFYGSARRDDLTLLYFTGHGLKDDEGRLYLAMTNTRREALMFTAISAAQLNDAMDACPSRRKVLILDCCYSGAFPAGRTAKADEGVQTLERFQGKGRAVLTASDATQYAFEGDDLTGAGTSSVFTRYLVEAIRSGAADLDEDGDIALDELYSYVRDRVVAEMPQQRPKKQEDVDGRILIARNVHWTLPDAPAARDREPDRRAAAEPPSRSSRTCTGWATTSSARRWSGGWRRWRPTTAGRCRRRRRPCWTASAAGGPPAVARSRPLAPCPAAVRAPPPPDARRAGRRAAAAPAPEPDAGAAQRPTGAHSGGRASGAGRTGRRDPRHGRAGAVPSCCCPASWRRWRSSSDPDSRASSRASTATAAVDLGWSSVEFLVGDVAAASPRGRSHPRAEGQAHDGGGRHGPRRRV